MSELRSIGEVLAILETEFPNVTISKIRFLESQGLIRPERTPSGYRQFNSTDIEQLRWVLTEQRDNFLPLRVLRDRIHAGDWRPVRTNSPVEVDPSTPGARTDNLGVGHSVDQETDTDPVVASSPLDASEDDALTSPSGDEISRQQLTGREMLDLRARRGEHTVDEVAKRAALDISEVRELTRYGILDPVTTDPVPLFDDDAIVIATAASAFMVRGVEPRHLKAWRTSADREANLLEQLTLPLLRQGSDAAQQQAMMTAAELVEIGGQLRYALLRRALRRAIGDAIAPRE